MESPALVILFAGLMVFQYLRYLRKERNESMASYFRYVAANGTLGGQNEKRAGEISRALINLK